MEKYEIQFHREYRGDGKIYFYAIVLKKKRIFGFIRYNEKYGVGSLFSDKPVLQEEKYFGHQLFDTYEKCRDAADDAVLSDYKSELHNKVVKIERI